MTATEQWDHLLSLAKDFGMMDNTRGTQETSDEEAEEEFIDDGDSEAGQVPLALLLGYGLMPLTILIA